MTADELLTALKEEGLFLAPLNNGDWISGRASSIYMLRVTSDHYKDPYLCVGSDALLVIAEAIGKFGASRNRKR